MLARQEHQARPLRPVVAGQGHPAMGRQARTIGATQAGAISILPELCPPRFPGHTPGVDSLAKLGAFDHIMAGGESPVHELAKQCTKCAFYIG